MDASLMSQRKALQNKNLRLKKRYADAWLHFWRPLKAGG
jgi:hypothetical protein